MHQYVNRATTALRSALKEPAKTKAAASETFSFNVATWEAGEMGAKKALGKAP